ncbi:hypothetical protein L0Y46_01465 [bacterium]|nr:hypothetical protein [bacterium]
MNNLTPFSGLSVIIHLGIILLAKALTPLVLFVRRIARKIKKLHAGVPQKPKTYMERKKNRERYTAFFSVVSEFIIIMVFGTVVYFFGIAIETSVRENNYEDNATYVKAFIENF